MGNERSAREQRIDLPHCGAHFGGCGLSAARLRRVPELSPVRRVDGVLAEERCVGAPAVERECALLHLRAEQQRAEQRRRNARRNDCGDVVRARARAVGAPVRGALPERSERGVVGLFVHIKCELLLR